MNGVKKRCENCGEYKDLSNGEIMIYTKDRNLETVAVCSEFCKKSFVMREIDDLINKVDWLRIELEEN